METIDINNEENSEGTEDNILINKHRKERKELQAKIQSLKKSASKGDKKKRKEVLEEISKLEIDLESRQAKELNELNHEKTKGNGNASVNDEENKNENLKEKQSTEDGGVQQPRISKAQRRRDRKAKEEKEKEAEIQAQEELNKTGPRMIELQTIKNLLKSRGLMLHSIPSDGNCLYNAIRHQLELTDRIVYDIPYLRNETAKYILQNKETLISYMTNTETGNILTDDEFINYCDAIRTTSAWGGQIEIKALSQILQVPIEILQASGPPTIQGDQEYNDPALVITYHRHMYSLGEHYNSTKPLIENDGDGISDNDGYDQQNEFQNNIEKK